MTQRANVGDWVQIERIVLKPGERAPDLPEDTKRLPLVMRVKGFALEPAEIGEEVTIKTVIGRTVRGKLVGVNPTYPHDFGRPIVELLQIAPEVRAMLADGDETQ